MNWTRVERAAEHAGGRLDRQRLRQARDALDQQMALREQADEHPLEHRLLAGDHPPDLEQRRTRGSPDASVGLAAMGGSACSLRSFGVCTDIRNQALKLG